MNEFNILQKVEKINKRTTPKRRLGLNFIKAFSVGGLICAFGQVIYLIFLNYFDKELSSSYTILSLILVSSVLTCLGLYDRIGQFAGCGTIIPITGFANSMTSSAIEYRPEGIITGILNNVFKLAGSVIVVAIVSGVCIGFIRYIGGVIFG